MCRSFVQRTLIATSFLLAGALCTACDVSHDASDVGDAAIDAGRDAAQSGDAAVDAGGGGGGAIEHTFVVENRGTTPIVLGGTCGQRWLELARNDDALTYDRSCSCACEQGGACGCPAVCLNTQELLVPGTSASLEWDGIEARARPAEGCYELNVPSRGESLSARACIQVEEGSDRECSSTPFEYGADANVTLEAPEASWPSSSTTFVLRNDTTGPIEIVTSRCGKPAWFELAIADQPITAFAYCICGCNDEFGLGACPDCEACAEDQSTTLAPGQSHSYEWNGSFMYRYPSDCHAQYDMPTGFYVDASVCWTVQGEASSHCQPFSFVHGLGEATISAL